MDQTPQSMPDYPPDQSFAWPILTLTATTVSPLFGQWANIGLAATFGALWTISRVDGLKLWIASKMFFRAMTVALVFTGLIAHFLSAWLSYEVHHFLGPVAFVLAWVGDRWLEYRDRAMDTIASTFGGLLSRKEKKP